MPTQRLGEKRVEEHVGEREREGEREKERTRGRERERKSTLAPPFICFFFPWACPVQTGLSQECSLFYLKSSLWSFDLPCFFATAVLDSFSLFYLPNIQEVGDSILRE